MHEFDVSIHKLLDILDYHFFIVNESTLDKIKSLVAKCHYNEALWMITKCLDPFVEDYEDLVLLLNTSWTLYYRYLQFRLKECEANYQDTKGETGYMARQFRIYYQRAKGVVSSCEAGERKMLEYRDRIEKSKRRQMHAQQPIKKIHRRSRSCPISRSATEIQEKRQPPLRH